MFDNNTLAASVLSNPACVQSLVLTEFQNRLNGVYSVVDPNNTFNLLLEASSSMNAQSVRLMESQFSAQYAVRATTSAELYNHMSDFDYLNMVAGPSSTTINLTFNLDYLIANAVSYDSTYKRVIIPVDTQFYIGPLTFGIYYPININISKITNNINVLWDPTISNPLQTLETNMIPFNQYSTGGLNLITLTIPVSQFFMVASVYPVVSQQGFLQTISYTDQFYAIRVCTNTQVGGGWTELSYTLSETVYDPTTPTAKINVNPDTNTLVVSIPQIYFTNKQIGNLVQVLLYTTKGAMTLDLTSVEVSACNVNFGLSAPGASPYSSILANMSTIDLTPAETVISGGSSALSFSALRSLVINGGLYSGVPITPAQLNTFAEKQGFTLTKYIDNVTNRIYYASNNIQGGQNGYIMVTTGTISVTPIGTLPSTIRSFPTKNVVTILPTTIYSFSPSNHTCTPLSDSQITILGNMTKAQLATEFNTNTYTKCPFHIVTYTGSQYPVTKSFNLMDPSVKSIRFITDNVYLVPQMSVVVAAVIHNADGTGGYTLRLGVSKTDSMKTIPESALTVYLSATDSSSDLVFYGIATMTGTSGLLTVYEMKIPTTYYITQENTFESNMFVVGAGGTTPSIVSINLETTFTVSFLITPSLYPNVPQNTDITNSLSEPYNTLLGISQQQLDVVFGIDLSSQVYNPTNALWSAIKYAIYPETVYLTYTDDVYKTNSKGGLVYKIENGTVVLDKIHNKGDTILDPNGDPIIHHAAGSIKLDANGNPIVMDNRQLNYYVSSMMFDLRLFYSENQADITFTKNLTSTMMSYFSTLTNIQSNLLEQTSLYYKPNRTMGTATFSTGNDNLVQLNLEFSFAFNVYVPQAVLDNPVNKAQIVADITSITQTEMTKSVISLTDISQNVRTQLSDTVYSLDVEGIDGNQSLQTIIVPNGSITPIVAQRLVYDNVTDTLSLQSAISINFILAA